MTVAKPLFGASAALTITLNGLADGASALSNEIDNSVIRAYDDELTVNVVGSDVAESGSVDIYILRGDAAGHLSDAGNAERVCSVTLNGTTAVQRTVRVYDLPEFYQYRMVHRSSGGYALAASGNSASVKPVNPESI
jgi:hypothetical protein